MVMKSEFMVCYGFKSLRMAKNVPLIRGTKCYLRGEGLSFAHLDGEETAAKVLEDMADVWKRTI